MKWIDRLEKKYGKYGIHNLMLYIIFGTVSVFVLARVSSSLYANIIFIPELVLKGEIWRAVTFIFVPPTTNIIFLLFAMFFYYFIGSRLESFWGAFRFNMYYFIGYALTLAIGLIFRLPINATYLNLSLFLAFATLDPEMTVRLYMIIPVKIKYLAWLNWAFFAYTIIFSPLSMKLMAIVGLANYFLFFGKAILTNRSRQINQINRKRSFQKKSSPSETKYKQTGGDNVIQASFHKCFICGITEVDKPDMEFRYCSKCEGYKEYCTEHLYSHDHH
jgi:hypothetical protein